MLLDCISDRRRKRIVYGLHFGSVSESDHVLDGIFGSVLESDHGLDGIFGSVLESDRVMGWHWNGC